MVHSEVSPARGKGPALNASLLTPPVLPLPRLSAHPLLSAVFPDDQASA